MQKFKPYLLFFTVSLLVLIITSYYHWWDNSSRMTQIDYISHPDWSRPTSIASGLNSIDYLPFPDKDGITIFWIERIKQTFREKLYVQKINYRGDVIVKPILLKDSQIIKGVGVEKVNNKFHLFWLSGEEESNLDLKYWVLDQNYQIEETKILTTGLNYTNQLQTINYQDSIYLVWSTGEENYYKTDLVKYDLQTGDLTIQQISNLPEQNILPNLTIGNDQIHVLWLERDPNIMYNTRAVDISNMYKLMYRKFDLNCNPLQEKAYIDHAALTAGTVAPQIIYNQDRLCVVWNKFNDEIRLTNPGRWLYYSSFTPAADKINITRLTPKISFASAPSLIKNKGQFKLAYINSQEQDLVLGTLDFTNPENPSLREVTRLFTDQKVGFQPLLFEDPEENLNILWVEMEGEDMKLYYATTKYPHKPGILETLGMKVEKKGMYFWAYLGFIILYFYTFPLYTVFINFDVVLWPVLLLLGLMLLGSKSKKLSFLKKVNNPYLAFFASVGALLLKCRGYGHFYFLFTNFMIPTPFAYYIIGFAFLASLFCLWRIKSNPRHFILLGGLCFLFWLYVINQANFIFQIHEFTF